MARASASDDLMARIAFLRPVQPGSAEAAFSLAHARSSSAGAYVFDRPRMSRQETNDCSTIARLARTRPIADAVSGPMRIAHDANRSGDHGPSRAAWFSGMCSTLVEYCPLRPRGLGCAAATSPPCITVTADEVSFTSTCSPMSEWSTE